MSEDLEESDGAVFATMRSDEVPTLVEEPVGVLTQDAFDERYETRTLLGRGGMGKVLLTRDHRIGRNIAMKLADGARAKSPAFRARFLREARIQARLEHPAFVPVYDLGVDPHGADFFTMKRITGVTLQGVLGALAFADPAAERRNPRAKLLDVFQKICLAVDYAHARGVVHRDLKPGNIMIGEFGEVYVLDWGLAKVLAGSAQADRGGDYHATVQGQILGTPGYMAPEQSVEAHRADHRADIYALGAILFEILTLEPLHRGETAVEILRSTQAGADARASARAPEKNVPPELEALCVRATNLNAAQRPSSVRELHDVVGRFLDGDRDHALRAEIAASRAERAEEAARRALAGGPGADEHRATAIQEAGRALALDPDSPAALRILTTLLVHPPTETPPEVTTSLRDFAQNEDRRGARFATVVYSAFTLIALGASATGILDHLWLASIVAPVAGAAALSAYAGWRQASPTAAVLLPAVVLAYLSIAAASGIYGPLVLVPGLAASNTVATTAGLLKKHRTAILCIALGSVVFPTILEWSGVLPPSYGFRNGTFEIYARVVHSPEVSGRVALFVATLLGIVAPALIAGRLHDALLSARKALDLHLWHLRQLVAGGRQ